MASWRRVSDYKVLGNSLRSKSNRRHLSPKFIELLTWHSCSQAFVGTTIESSKLSFLSPLRRINYQNSIYNLISSQKLVTDNHSQILTIPSIKSGSGYDSIVLNWYKKLKQGPSVQIKKDLDWIVWLYLRVWRHGPYRRKYDVELDVIWESNSWSVYTDMLHMETYSCIKYFGIFHKFMACTSNSDCA